MVLAPALGEGGRALFRRWAGQLLAAVVSKLLFSFLLGVVLAVLGILASLRALGWWTQWLLMSAFWWGAYLRRHQALGSHTGRSQSAGLRPHAPAPRSVARRVSDTLETRKAMAAMGWAKGRRARADSAADMPRPSSRDATGGPVAGRARAAARPAHRTPPAKPALTDRRRLTEQLARVEGERKRAELAGDRRRALRTAGTCRSHRGGNRCRGRRTIRSAAVRRGAASELAPAAGAGSGRRAFRLSAAGQGAARGWSPGPRAPSARPPVRGSGAGPPEGAAEGGRPHAAIGRGGPSDSDVMRDAREVEAGRKRFLGPDLP